MSRITIKKIVELQSIVDLCTPGPWIWSDIKHSGSGGSHKSLVAWNGGGTFTEKGRDWWLGPDEFNEDTCVISFHEHSNLKGEDADLFAASRTSIPDLIDEVERLNHLLSAIALMIAQGIQESDRDIRPRLAKVIALIDTKSTPPE